MQSQMVEQQSNNIVTCGQRAVIYRPTAVTYGKEAVIYRPTAVTNG